ncbi:MAG TPA: aldehyde ferredoxin oxidoreductase family protein [Anaerolineaceae bacterium]
MGYGTTGKILRVDLTKSVISIETFDEGFYRKYPGGKALAAYYLLKECPAGVDPLGPDNVLIMAAGLITGAPIATATRYTVAARSPLTEAYGESEAGGFWGPELKFAGYDAIIFKGKAPHPVYLWVHDGEAEIRDARHLWGREPFEVQADIRAELGDDLVRVLQIGVAGENLVRYAAITNELRHFNGRNGMGAVMGSKNLRAVAVRGHMKYADLAHDYPAILEITRRLAKDVKTHPQSADLTEKGTPGLVLGLNAAGILPTKNFKGGAFDGVAGIGWDSYKEILTARKSCYACSVRCKREVTVNDRYQVSPNYGGPEYETVAAFGSNCGVSDLQAVAKANELCDRYLLDSISCGSTVSFAMECFENGLLTLEDTGGIELRFGNAEAMLQVVELIGKRQGIGNLLAEGTCRASQAIGAGAGQFALHIKGQELPMHDPRGKVGLGLGYAISENGADHLTAIHDPTIANPESIPFKGAVKWGLKEAIPPREMSLRKVEAYQLFENWSSFGKCVGYCYFGPAPRSFIQAEDILGSIQAATGWDVDLAELLQMGERATNLARLFNTREGFTSKDDTLPERLFQPLETGALTGVAMPRDLFEWGMKELYRLKGWNPETGIPQRGKLDELDLGWAADLVGIET